MCLNYLSLPQSLDTSDFVVWLNKYTVMGGNDLAFAKVVTYLIFFLSEHQYDYIRVSTPVI